TERMPPYHADSSARRTPERRFRCSADHPPYLRLLRSVVHWILAMLGRHASRNSVFFVLLQRVSKITVTGALHDCLRPGELHVGTKAFCMRKIRTTCQQESQLRCADLVIELSVPS